MANSFLISKWKMWFKWLDINKDGKLDFKDMDAARKRFAELNNLKEDEKKTTMDVFKNWWDDFIFSGKDELSEKEFINSFNEQFKSNKDLFIDKMNRCFQVAFNLVDRNSEKLINEEEFIMGFRTSGHDNIELDKQFFKLYSPKDGLVSVGALVDSWVQFTTSEDTDKPDIVKTAFEMGV